jgi:cephalosporin hydroxylase
MEKIKMTGTICPSPHIKRMKELKDEMGDKCKVYCETGCLYGGSLILQMQSKIPCKFISIDLFNGYYGKNYDPHRKIDLTNHIEIVKKNLNNNNPHNHEYILIKGDSKDIKICNQINDKIDFLFIDGDHSKQGVTMDFLNLKDKINKGGLIVFDNYNDNAWTEVKPAVDELCDEYTNEYFIKEVYGNMLCLEKK